MTTRYQTRSMEMQALTIALIIHAAILFGYGILYAAPLLYAETKMVKIRLGGGGGLELSVIEAPMYQEITGPRKVKKKEVVPVKPTTNETTQVKQETENAALANTKPLAKPMIKRGNGSTEVKTTAGKNPGVPGAPVGAGAPYGNTTGEGQVAANDYLELLQYTVQENSVITPEARGLRGTAVIRVLFTRLGTVIGYSIQKRTGKAVLDDAVVALGEKLKITGFPAPPPSLDAGEQLLKYDFLVRYPPKNN